MVNNREAERLRKSTEKFLKTIKKNNYTIKKVTINGLSFLSGHLTINSDFLEIYYNNIYCDFPYITIELIEIQTLDIEYLDISKKTNHFILMKQN